MVYGAYHFTILYPGLRFFVNVRRPSATLLTAVSHAADGRQTCCTTVAVRAADGRRTMNHITESG